MPGSVSSEDSDAEVISLVREKKLRKRKRKRCLKCGQYICHNAYNRHLNNAIPGIKETAKISCFSASCLAVDDYYGFISSPSNVSLEISGENSSNECCEAEEDDETLNPALTALSSPMVKT